MANKTTGNVNPAEGLIRAECAKHNRTTLDQSHEEKFVN